MSRGTGTLNKIKRVATFAQVLRHRKENIMTNREFYSAVASGNITAEVQQFASDAIVKLDERNAKRSSQPSKTAIANEPIMADIVKYLTEVGVAKTSPDIGAAIGQSTQKTSALCNQLAERGTLTKTEGKVPKKGKMKFYAIAPKGEVAED